MRLFIAIEVSDDVRRELVRAQERLKATGADIKPVEPENIHLTLKFLGEVSEERIGDISAAIDRSASGRGIFPAGVRGIGVFPDLRHVRVIWAGVGTGSERIVEIQRSLDAELQALGFERERDFVPHITLARVRSPRGKERLAAEVRSMSGMDFGSTEVRSVVLKQSTLTPRGPIYTTVAETML
ncbi:MAG: RNA 2',3'-cyclic phosphodiesterase [Candidatus Hadarchaeales archaeon]